MRNRIFRAFVIWKDGDVEDADEIQVFAPTAEEAKRAALKKWRLTIGHRWARCVPVDVEIESHTRCSGGVAT